LVDLRNVDLPETSHLGTKTRAAKKRQVWGRARFRNGSNLSTDPSDLSVVAHALAQFRICARGRASPISGKILREIGRFLKRRPSREQPFRNENARSEKVAGVGKGGISKQLGSVGRSVGFIGRRPRALPISHLRARRFEGRSIGRFLKRRPSREQPFRNENARSEKATRLWKGEISKRLGSVGQFV